MKAFALGSSERELAVYVHPAYTRYADRMLLQLVYTIWFPERPARGAVDFLAGRLDGLIWRDVRARRRAACL